MRCPFTGFIENSLHGKIEKPLISISNSGERRKRALKTDNIHQSFVFLFPSEIG